MAVNRLAEVFTADARVAVVSALTGQRGAGKTQVAAAYARQAVVDGVELVAWVSADDLNRLLAGLAEVARGLAVADPEGDSEKSAARLRDALATRTTPAVLVLDNASDPQAVRHYLPTTGATRVIITSTDRAFARLGADVAVDRFERRQSLAYLSQRTSMADDLGADAVAKELDDLPLALAQAASVIALQGLRYEVYLDRLRSLPLEEMLPKDRGDPYPHSVARAIVLSIDAVENDDATGLTRRVLAAAALLATDGVSRRVLAEILDLENDAHRLDDVLARIVEASLAVWTADREGVVMHRLVARAIRDRLQTVADLEASIAETASGLGKLLITEDQAWDQRHASTEIVGHTIELWENIAIAATRGALTRESVEKYTHLAHWAVRHLCATTDLSRAIDIGTSELATCERVLGPEHPDTLASRNNLAGAYESAGKLDLAIPLYEQTLADRERVLGSEHPDTLASRNNLAGAYESAGKLDLAIPLYEQTLADRERVLGSEHPDTLTFRNNLAYAYESAGKLEQAIPLYGQTLADRERVLGSEHPNTLTSRNNLAGAYRSAGKLDQAIPLYKQTLADRERVLGPEHPNTLTSRNNLAGAYESAGKLEQAIPLHEQTLADRERVLGPQHPNTLTSRNNLAGAYESAGKLDQAIPLYKQTLADRERVLGPEHPNTLTSRNNLAGAYESAGKLEQAIPLYEQALADRERVLGPEHPNTLTSRNNLAGAYWSAGKLEQAIPLYEQTLADSERILGKDHPLTTTVRTNLEQTRTPRGGR